MTEDVFYRSSLLCMGPLRPLDDDRVELDYELLSIDSERLCSELELLLKLRVTSEALI